MPKIQSISASKKVNSRGDWTVEAIVELSNGIISRHVVPEGASKGKKEAISLPVEIAIYNIESKIAKALHSFDVYNQKEIDSVMISLDGTQNKIHLGGNAMLAVSIAVCKAAAQSKNLEPYEYVADLYGNKILEFPTPVFNILNGGRHANNKLTFQEFMVIPARRITYDKAYEMGVHIYRVLKKRLADYGYSTDVGDEGGFAPEGLTANLAFEMLRDAASERYIVGDEVFLGSDVAADSFRKLWRYIVKEENLVMDSNALITYYKEILRKFEIIYLEDVFYENDHAAWKKFYNDMKERLLIVGDDLVVTSPHILRDAIEKEMINAVIVKPNQVGTLSETLEFIKIAKTAGLLTVVSHRSGDTAEDTFIADLAYGVSSDFIKSGAPARGERVSKYNRLYEIYTKVSK